MNDFLFRKFSDLPEASDPPRVRGSETSEAAAQSVIPSVGPMQQRVIDCLRARGEHGATAKELESELGLAHENVTARLWELTTRWEKRHPGVASPIRKTARKRTQKSGRKAFVYVFNGD